MPWDQYRYAAYARRFGWTPEQVDQIPLVTEPWIFPIAAALDEAEARVQREAQEAAERRQRKVRRPR